MKHFTWMGDRISMSISIDNPSIETLNRGPLALLLRRQYEFPFEINIVQFSFSFFRLTDRDLDNKFYHLNLSQSVNLSLFNFFSLSPSPYSSDQEGD